MTFVLFGATGDLAKRKIFPALFNLFIEQKIPSQFSIIGMGRKPQSDDDFQRYVSDQIHTFSRRKPENQDVLNAFLSHIRYTDLNVANPADYIRLLDVVKEEETRRNMPENRMFYFSVSPEFFEPIAENIKSSGLGTTNGWKRLVIEKPFGHDLDSARVLNQQLSETFEEHEVFRIDHYLGKGMVQNLETVRSSNVLFDTIWNRNYVSNVQITAVESVGVEERAAYYDHSGALRDMVQNHLLQMLMMVAMDPPNGNIRDKKTEVMKALRVYRQQEEIQRNVVRAQYEGYLQEPGVVTDSHTDTFIAARLFIDNERWEGVPFYLRTGKKFDQKMTKISLELKDHNVIDISINPTEGVRIQTQQKNAEGQLEPVALTFSDQSVNTPEGYERLIFDALRGDARFFARWDEVELSWNWVQPILDAFTQGNQPLHTYSSGSNGPSESHQLIKEDGFEWH